jgi:lysophospholipid hydrolase
LVTIALVPASKNGDETVTAALAAALRVKLSRFGPTLLLDERAARAAHSDGTVTRLENAFYRSKLTGWMAQQEENYRFILLRADASGSAWSQVCVSQADRVLVVARTTHETKESLRDLPGVTPSRAERRLLWRRRRGAAVELILVHDPGCAPRSTAKWRASRPEVERHHMLRLSSEEDVERLARHVAGRAVGVVLTGGGGHGLAHLGALRALEDLGVPVDVVGGTSRGALMAALYAKYASTTHMLPRVKELVGALSSPRHLLTDLTLPILSVFSGKGLDKILRQSLGEDDVEDLWLPFFCCSTNLTRGSLSTHVSGAAWKRVRASMTTLGLLPPVRDDESNELLVDGGYLNAIPADVMRETMGVDVVIAIDVEDDDYLAFRDLTPRDGGLGGWRLLWERVNPLAALSSSSKKKNDAGPRLVRRFVERSASRDVETPVRASLARTRHQPVLKAAGRERLDRAAHAETRGRARTTSAQALLRRRRGVARARGARGARRGARRRRDGRDARAELFRV